VLKSGTSSRREAWVVASRISRMDSPPGCSSASFRTVLQ